MIICLSRITKALRENKSTSVSTLPCSPTVFVFPFFGPPIESGQMQLLGVFNSVLSSSETVILSIKVG